MGRRWRRRGLGEERERAGREREGKREKKEKNPEVGISDLRLRNEQ